MSMYQFKQLPIVDPKEIWVNAYKGQATSVGYLTYPSAQNALDTVKGTKYEGLVTPVCYVPKKVKREPLCYVIRQGFVRGRGLYRYYPGASHWEMRRFATRFSKEDAERLVRILGNCRAVPVYAKVKT